MNNDMNKYLTEIHGQMTQLIGDIKNSVEEIENNLMNDPDPNCVEIVKGLEKSLFSYMRREEVYTKIRQIINDEKEDD